MLVSWWNQCQSISQWEIAPWESSSKLPFQSFVSPPPKSFYRLGSKECDTSVSLRIVSLDHAGRAGFSWCAHGKRGHERGHLWQYCMWGCLILFCLSSTDIVTLLPPKWPDFQMLHLIPNCGEQTSSLCFDIGGWECGTEAAPAEGGTGPAGPAGIILPLSQPPQNLKTIPLYFWRKTTSLLLTHCCLAPCKSVTNYGPLTEPKFYVVKSGLTQISTSNGDISETKKGCG